MEDKTLENIKNGKGLTPLSNDIKSSNKQSGITVEQRTRSGIHKEIAELKDKSKK